MENEASAYNGETRPPSSRSPPRGGSTGRAGEGNAVGSPAGFQHPVRWKDNRINHQLRRERRSSSSTRQACSSGSPAPTAPRGTRRASTRTQRTALPSFVLGWGSGLLRLCWALRTRTTRTTSATTNRPPHMLMRATQNRAMTAIPTTPRTFFSVTKRPRGARHGFQGFQAPKS